MRLKSIFFEIFSNTPHLHFRCNTFSFSPTDRAAIQNADTIKHVKVIKKYTEFPLNMESLYSRLKKIMKSEEFPLV